MKLKNTLGVVIGSLVAASAMNAFAQGQNSVEIEAFGKRYFTDSVRNMKNADLYGGPVRRLDRLLPDRRRRAGAVLR